MSDKNYTNVLLEDMNSKFDSLIEIVGQLRDNMKGMARQSDLEEVKADAKIIKAAVTNTNRQVTDHEMRITELEAA